MMKLVLASLLLSISFATLAASDQAKEVECRRLIAEKQSIEGMQRQRSTQALADRHREVVKRIQDLGCSYF